MANPARDGTPMTEIQILQALADGGMTALVLAAFVYYARDTQRREREAREDFSKREAMLLSESKRREEQLIADGKRREELLIAEFQRRETNLMNMVNSCAERFDKFTTVLARLETWLRKTD